MVSPWDLGPSWGALGVSAYCCLLGKGFWQLCFRSTLCLANSRSGQGLRPSVSLPPLPCESTCPRWFPFLAGLSLSSRGLWGVCRWDAASETTRVLKAAVQCNFIHSCSTSDTSLLLCSQGHESQATGILSTAPSGVSAQKDIHMASPEWGKLSIG